MEQKHILMLKNMNSEEDKETIEDILKEAGIEANVSLINKSVSIFSRGDAVASAKRLINEKGFLIL